MKLFLSLILLGLIPLYGQAPKATLPREEVVDYNIGSCGGQHFTVYHAHVSDNNIVFTHHLLDPQTIIENDEPDVFNISKEAKDGLIKFNGNLQQDDPKRFEVHGFIKDNRLVMILTVDGELGHAFYGEKGALVDMVKVASEYHDFCDYLHKQDVKDIPDEVVKWLNHAKDSQ